MKKKNLYILLVTTMATLVFYMTRDVDGKENTVKNCMTEQDDSTNAGYATEDSITDDTSTVNEEGMGGKRERRLEKIIEYGRTGDFEKLSQYVSYPLSRNYPLPQIKDSADFVKYAGIIWDDSLKHVLSNLEPEDWGSYGWRGFSFGDGQYLWADDDGFIFSINYYSNKELELKEKIFRKEIKQLHPSLQKGIDYTRIGFKDLEGEVYGRMDIMKNKKRRLALYHRIQGLSDLPLFAATDSIFESTGYTEETYHFIKDSVRIEFSYSYYFESYMSVYTKGDTITYKLDCENRNVTVQELYEEGMLE